MRDSDLNEVDSVLEADTQSFLYMHMHTIVCVPAHNAHPYKHEHACMQEHTMNILNDNNLYISLNWQNRRKIESKGMSHIILLS